MYLYFRIKSPQWGETGDIGKEETVMVTGSYGDWKGWGSESKYSVWPWSVEKNTLLKTEGKGEEEEGRFSKACKHNKMEEARVFLLDGLHVLNKVRGTIQSIKEWWRF